MLELKFQEILRQHEHNIEYALRMRNENNKKFWDGFIYASFKNFEDLKIFCKDSIHKTRTELTEEEKELYDNQKDYPLIGILDYRGEKIPIYSDDYGQQDLALINGRLVGGGAYNFCSESEFEYLFDSNNDLTKNNVEVCLD